MREKRATSSLLSKYTLLFEKNPRSRVFAPLAEVYRKLGMIDESFKILKEGIKFHPTYTLGYIVLAQCYYDLGNADMAYNTIRPFVNKSLENITLQKLFANICMQLGHHEEALQTYKYLLLINNRDEEVALQVKNLEDNILAVKEETVEDEYKESFIDEDQWVQVDFNSDKSETDFDRQIDDWSQENTLDKFKKEILNKEIQIKHHSLDDQYFHEDYDVESEDVLEFTSNKDESTQPIITHTLVDLYCSQGHTQKAREILESILEIHPDDKATIKRLSELSEGFDSKVVSTDMNTENDGQGELDKQVENFKEENQKKLEKIEEKFAYFHHALKTRSQKIDQKRQ